MNLTPQQRKALWICVALVVAYYLVREYATYSMQAAYYQQQAIRAQQIAKAKAIAASPSAKVSGIWRGKTALESLGTCDIRLEVLEKTAGHFTGYSSLSCMPPKGTGRAAIPDLTNPDSAILTGTLDEIGAIHWHVDKTIGKDINGCALTSFTITPFGASQLAAEWEKGTCTGGHVVLQRARS